MIRRLLSAEDRTIELNLVLGALAVIAFIFYTGWTVIVQGQHFEPTAFGSGLALTLGGMSTSGLLQGMQRRIQPPEPPAGLNISQ